MKNELLDFLKAGQEQKKITVLGVGSEFKSDDAAGLKVAEGLSRFEDKNKLQVIFGGTAPENYTADIKRFAPTHLILVDAAEMGERPGTVKIIPKDKIDGISFSTHVLPLSVMLNYLSQSFNFQTVVIGIEPKNMEFGEGITKEVKEAVNKIVSTIIDVYGGAN